MATHATSTVPFHVALIPDGNRRWAKQEGKMTTEGHLKGYERVRDMISFAEQVGVKVFTLWAFSTENWKRKEEEVFDLMLLIEKGLSDLHKESLQKKYRVVHVGRRDRISPRLLDLIISIEEETKNYTLFTLCIALDYGGTDELERASSKLLMCQDKGKVLVDFLDTAEASLPLVDCVIRTGGEKRTSGFMPTQSAYAEWVFVETLLPDFDDEAFKKALTEYSSRVRRFGK